LQADCTDSEVSLSTDGSSYSTSPNLRADAGLTRSVQKSKTWFDTQQTISVPKFTPTPQALANVGRPTAGANNPAFLILDLSEITLIEGLLPCYLG
jgi:hypothetical protein